MYLTTPFIDSFLQYVKVKPQQPFYGSGFMYSMFEMVCEMPFRTHPYNAFPL